MEREEIVLDGVKYRRVRDEERKYISSISLEGLAIAFSKMEEKYTVLLKIDEDENIRILTCGIGKYIWRNILREVIK